MAPALPGARGLFSLLQDSLQHATRNRVRVTRQVLDMAQDFRMLTDSLHLRPTRLPELVPGHPSFVGASDASGVGMGGVWFTTSDAFFPPTLWRQRFDPSVQASLVTNDNRAGAISISDLELAAMIGHKDVLAQHSPVHETTIWLAIDNRAALSWSNKGSATSSAARAYLLRLNALHQRAYHYVALHNHIAGAANVMADDASRLWALSDSALLTHFDSTYPQALPWRISTLSSALNSALTGALFCKRQPLEFPHNASTRPLPLGKYGTPSVPHWASTRPNSPKTLCLSSKSSPNASGMAPSLPAVDLFGLERWRTPSELWGRRMPAWGPSTLD
jgi:hypothetical protein